MKTKYNMKNILIYRQLKLKDNYNVKTIIIYENDYNIKTRFYVM